MKLIIGAQKEEINAIISLFSEYKEDKINDFPYYKGKINDQDCILVQGGIGAASTVMLVTLFSTLADIEYVINVGTAGGVNNKNLKVTDVVVSNSLAYYDADVTFFNYKYGQMAGCPRSFKADENLINKILEINPNIRKGDMLSGDKFIVDKHHPMEHITKNFSDLDILTVDMESCAVANACYLLKIPFVILRVVSDIIESHDQGKTYEEVLQISGQDAAEIINKLI